MDLLLKENTELKIEIEALKAKLNIKNIRMEE
jgi:hypothetical protein